MIGRGMCGESGKCARCPFDSLNEKSAILTKLDQGDLPTILMTFKFSGIVH